jgi:hypothetical protein
VVPPAFRADLHDVTNQLLLSTAQLVELCGCRRAAAVRWKMRTEDVGDVDQALVLADRADLVEAHSDVACGPHQLRMGIADIEARETSLVELLHDRVPG